MPYQDYFRRVFILFTGIVFLSVSIGVEARGNPIKKLQKKVQDLQEQVDELKEAGQPQHITVDCASGDTVTAALESVENETVQVTITIAGTCDESIIIRRDNVTLKGATPSDGLQGTAGVITVHVIGANNVQLESMTISGGGAGLECVRTANVDANNITISGAEQGVLTAAGGMCVLLNSVIEGNGTGVVSAVNGTVYLFGNTVVDNNTGDGVQLLSGGALLLGPDPDDSAKIPTISNNGNGISLTGNGSLFSLNGIVENNTGAGITLGFGSSLFLPSLIVRNNQGDGVNMGSLSNAFLLPGTSITGNGGFGVNCNGETALVNIATVSGNSAGDVSASCP